MAGKNVEDRVIYIAERCNRISPRLINKEQIIICLQMLSLASNTSKDTYQQRYLRMSLVAYNRALKENSLPIDKDLKDVYKESYTEDELKEIDEFYV